jgi:hypothetical protein
MVVASCNNKYSGTNFNNAVPTSLLIAPGLWTIQFLFNIALYSDLYMIWPCAKSNRQEIFFYIHYSVL